MADPASLLLFELLLCPLRLARLPRPNRTFTLFCSAAFGAYLEDADITDLPDSHAVQYFNAAAGFLTTRLLALAQHRAGHARLRVNFTSTDGSLLGSWLPGLGVTTGDEPMPEADASLGQQIRFPYHDGFLAMLDSYMGKNVPGELWLSSDDQAAFDPVADVLFLQRLRGVREDLRNSVEEQLQQLLADDSPLTTEAAIIAAWHRWLWTVEELLQATGLLACSTDLDVRLALRKRLETSAERWKTLESAIAKDTDALLAAADVSVGNSSSVVVVAGGEVLTSATATHNSAVTLQLDVVVHMKE